MMLRYTGTTAEVTGIIMRQTLGDDFPFENAYRETDVYFDEYVRTNGIPVKPYARDILATLKEKNIRTGLASSTREVTVRKELTDAGLIDYFKVLCCGDHVKKSKPDPEIFLTCAVMLDTDPKDCYVIEDSFNGIRAAAAAGMHPLMVPDLRQPDEEIRGLAEAVLPDLAAVREWIF
jgi:HAD superfamily hydrolase (TIGR01509 family)